MHIRDFINFLRTLTSIRSDFERFTNRTDRGPPLAVAPNQTKTEKIERKD